jgi:hypothetical protein
MLAGALAPGSTTHVIQVKGRDHTKCSPWSSKFAVGCETNDPNQEKFTATNSWRKPIPTQGFSTNKVDYIHIYTIKLLYTYYIGGIKVIHQQLSTGITHIHI